VPRIHSLSHTCYFFFFPFVFYFLFFFSSRRRHTRFSRDWSSDVCSSDLSANTTPATEPLPPRRKGLSRRRSVRGSPLRSEGPGRSEERRVGKEGRYRWWPDE